MSSSIANWTQLRKIQMNGSWLWKETKFKWANIGVKGNISNENLMIHVLDSLPKQYSAILDCLDNHCMSSGPDVFIIKMILEKLNHWHKKLKTKIKKKLKTAFVAYGKYFEGRCMKCGKYSNKLTDPKCPQNNRKEKKRL